MKIGDKVEMSLGGVQFSAIVRWPQNGDDMIGLTLRDGVRIAVQADCVEPVVPPCPWTEIGTVVACETANEDFPDLYRLNYRGTWYQVSTAEPVEYETVIAPRNPVELVPLQTPVAFKDQHAWTWRDADGNGRIVYGTKDAVLSLAHGEAVKA